jgi:hypothetical protein
MSTDMATGKKISKAQRRRELHEQYLLLKAQARETDLRVQRTLGRADLVLEMLERRKARRSFFQRLFG